MYIRVNTWGPEVDSLFVGSCFDICMWNELLPCVYFTWESLWLLRMQYRFYLNLQIVNRNYSEKSSKFSFERKLGGDSWKQTWVCFIAKRTLLLVEYDWSLSFFRSNFIVGDIHANQIPKCNERIPKCNERKRREENCSEYDKNYFVGSQLLGVNCRNNCNDC